MLHIHFITKVKSCQLDLKGSNLASRLLLASMLALLL